MPPAVSRLFDLCADVLAVIEAGWPGDAEPLPDLAYVADGGVAWDCPCLAVSLSRTFTAPDGDPALENFTSAPGLLGARVAVIDIALLRCVPDLVDNGNGTVSFPDPADVSAAAEVIDTDAQALDNVLIAAVKNGDLPGCSALVLENWTSAGPEGGLGGGVLRIRLATR